MKRDGLMIFPDLTRFTSDWTPAQRRRAALLCSVVALPIAFVLAPHLNGIFDQPDVSHYLALAQGRPAMLPFASRQLAPLIVRALVHIFGIPVPAGFVLLGVVAFVLFFASVLIWLLRSGAPRFLLAGIFGMLFWAWQFNALALPDLVYAALLCGFLLQLERQRFLLAALMMLPLAVSRESTLLTLACFLIAGWRRLRIAEAAAAIVSTAVGLLIVKRLAANALPNKEHISPMFYLLAKTPWTALKNFTGISPWSNVYSACAVPRAQIALHLGPVRAVGICGFEPHPPLLLLFWALGGFGLLPWLFLAVYRLRRPLVSDRTDSRGGLFLRFCVVYGVICFAIAGLLGESFVRLFAYSWPVFLVALPILLARAHATFTSNRAAVAFLATHLLLSWCTLVRDNLRLLPIEIALSAAGWFLLKNSLKSTSPLASKDALPVL